MGGDAWLELTEDIRLDLLELYGRDYVVDHCMVSLRKKRDELAFKVYVTDTMKMVAETLATAYGGKSPSKRYAEMIQPVDKKEEMTSDKVISKIRKKIGGGK